MASQVCHLLAGRCVVDSDDRCISSSREILVRRAERNGADRLHEPTQRMRQFTRCVVEDVDAAVLMARSSHLTIR